MLRRYIAFADKVSSWFGKAFAWCVIILTLGVGYEVFVRKLLRDPTSWAFDLSYMMYGALFIMAGAYTLSRDGHVRADVFYRLWRPRRQAALELFLYIIFFFPGILALVFAGWSYAVRSVGYAEVSPYSPANVPIFQFKLLLAAGGALLVIQGIAQVFRCILCLQDGYWPPKAADVEELEKRLLEDESVRQAVLHGQSVDAVVDAGPDAREGDRR
jgi:TRAP-type mannitol/chloroaromatic compound transport system permease small subunit